MKRLNDFLAVEKDAANQVGLSRQGINSDCSSTNNIIYFLFIYFQLYNVLTQNPLISGDSNGPTMRQGVCVGVIPDDLGAKLPRCFDQVKKLLVDQNTQ